MAQMQKTLKANPSMNKQRQKKSTPEKFTGSLTIPGQSLKPAELLKRHLAGTLPPIDLSSRYEYHYDDEGKQVAEPLPLELHEVHKLSVAIRQRQYEEALEARKKAAEQHKEEIISEYVKMHPNLKPKTAAEPEPEPVKPITTTKPKSQKS